MKPPNFHDIGILGIHTVQAEVGIAQQHGGIFGRVLQFWHIRSEVSLENPLLGHLNRNVVQHFVHQCRQRVLKSAQEVHGPVGLVVKIGHVRRIVDGRQPIPEPGQGIFNGQGHDRRTEPVRKSHGAIAHEVLDQDGVVRLVRDRFDR